MSFFLQKIDILPQCKMLKVLKPGEYPLVTLRNDESDFFGKNIMVSAIVGMNGSGKSSLLELVFRMINNLSAFMSQNSRRPAAVQIYYVEDIWADLYYRMDDKDGILHCRGNAMALDFGNKYFRFGNQYPDFSDPKYVFFEKMKAEDRINIMKCFFYTVVSNYSLQAYNDADYKDSTLEITENGRLYSKRKGGTWIHSLFHKNDGYLAAINLNPYRDSGQIDMQKEAGLAHSRMAAILIDAHRSEGNDRQFISGYDLERIDYKFDISTFKNKFKATSDEIYKNGIKMKVKPQMTVDELVDKFRKQLNKQESIAYCILNEFNVPPKSIHNSYMKIYGYLYIVYKVLSIASKYPAYSDYADDLGDPDLCLQDGNAELRKRAILLAKQVGADHSHITTKIEQTLHYLDKITTPQKRRTGMSFLENEIFDYETYSSLSYRQNTAKGSPSLERLMAMLPPPFFVSTIYLRNVKNIVHDDVHNKMSLPLIKMEDMSAGERQFYYAVSTLIYHVINLKSVPTNRVHYRHITLVLDEIELCFHPEYQRTFISRLINLIKRLHLNTYLAFHIVVTTHSPFILSDIPMENILYLSQGVTQDSSNFINPFGANINNILSQSFFLENGFMGAFAQEKINSLIEFLTMEKRETKEWNMEKAKWMIERIGEPLISQQLWIMYDKKFVDVIRIQREIESLKSRLKKMKEKR